MARILIVDDDADIVKSMTVVLESQSYEVITASSGQEGIETAKKEKPDLIILDVMMETISSGFNVAREIRNEEGIGNTPILMLTAIGDETGMDFGKEAGDEEWLPVNDYCDKPLNPDQLLKKVEKLLRTA